MDITEVRIKLMDDPQDRLQAFCSITFDQCFVVRDLKIIQGTKGSFVAMPSRKLTDRCPRCSAKNHLRSRFCSDCGAKLRDDRALKDDDGRAKLYADIAHPIHSDCRDMIQRKVLQAFAEEQEKAKLPGYVCAYDDYGEERYACLVEDGDESLDRPYLLPVDESLRRRDHGACLPQPHAVAISSRRNGEPARIAMMASTDDGSEEAFGAGLV